MRVFIVCVIVFLFFHPSSAQDVNAAALKSGCRVVASPLTYYTSNIHTTQIDPWTIQALVDEKASQGWCSAPYTAFPMTFVFELSEEFLIDKFFFNNECERSKPGICAKDIRIEVSSVSMSQGYVPVGDFTLNEYTTKDIRTHPFRARWIRLSILSNYGNSQYTELMEFKAMGVFADPSYNATNVVGLWDSNFDWVSIKQNEYGYIYGCYKWSNGKLYAGKVERRVFSFRWVQESDQLEGWCTVVINKEGTRLSGIWGYGNDYSSYGFWDFTKKSETPNPCWNDEEISKKRPEYTLKSSSSVKKDIVLLMIQMKDATNRTSIDGKVELFKDGIKIREGTTVNGAMSVKVPVNSKLILKAEGSGYLAATKEINVFERDVTAEIEMPKIKAGASIVMNTIRFERGKFDLLPESFPELDKIVRLMKDYPGIELEVAGHTDNVGDAQKNVKLSEDRAKEVKKYLVKKGVDPTRVTTAGYGGAKPIASNEKEETRRLNRRVEFTIIKM